MKSVLFLIPTLGGGGAERVLINLVNNLDKDKYDIHLQTVFKAGVNSKYLNNTISLHEGLFPQFHGNVFLLKFFSPQLLYKFIVKKKYDIVVSFLEGVTMRIIAGCPFPECKLYGWIHVEQQTRRRAAHCFRSFSEAQWCNDRFDKIICVAKSVEKDFNNIFHQEGNTVVIYNYIDVEGIREKSKEILQSGVLSNGINVFTCGRITEQKGFDRLIRVQEQMKKEGLSFHLYILGSGNSMKLQEEINYLGLENDATLLGYQNNPYKYMSKADIFVCSSRREGFSSVVAESLILGIPVVSTNVSGAKEMLGERNEFGIVTDNNESALYKGLLLLLKDDKLREHYKRMSKERSVMFSKSASIYNVENLFD